MKKAILFALLLSLVSVQQIQAQKWLKTLGKVANTVLSDDQKTDQKATDQKATDQKATATPIKPAGNTNMDNFACSFTSLNATFKSCARQGKQVIITVVFKNQGKFDLEFFPNDNKDAIYDSDGDTYKLDKTASQCCGTYWSSINVMAFPVGVPIKATYVIDGVPESVTEFNLIKIGFNQRYKPDPVYYLEFRNLPISAQ